MPINTVWGSGNSNLAQPGDPGFDPNNDILNGYQASCGGAANPNPLDYHLNEIGECLLTLETRITGLSTTGGFTVALDEITDVTLGTPVLNDVLTFNGTEWVAQANTSATSLGAGEDVFSGINGNELEFRSIASGSNIITVDANITDVVIDINVQNLLNDTVFQAALDQEIDERINPADITRVGGVFVQQSSVGGGTASVSLPAGGQWRFILVGGQHNSPSPRTFNPGFFSVNNNWDDDDDVQWRTAGQAPGGSTWFFSGSEQKAVSLFAIRIT